MEVKIQGWGVFFSCFQYFFFGALSNPSIIHFTVIFLQPHDLSEEYVERSLAGRSFRFSFVPLLQIVFSVVHPRSIEFPISTDLGSFTQYLHTSFFLPYTSLHVPFPLLCYFHIFFGVNDI